MRRRASAAAGGVVALGAAALLQGAGDRSLAAHVAEHQILVVVAAPLLAAAAPVRFALAHLGRDGRRRAGRALHALRWLAHPLGALALFLGAMTLVHLPAGQALAERSALAHAGEHAVLLGSATVLWAAALGADPLPVRSGPVARLAAVLAAMVAMAAFGALLASAAHPLYSAYPRLSDQRAAGFELWMGGMVVALPALLGSAWSALAAQERRQRRRELHGVAG